MARGLTRRSFLAGCAAAGAITALRPLEAFQRVPPPGSTKTGGLEHASPRTVALRSRFRDLPAHFVFEYYPWYGATPWRHWIDPGLTPPTEIAATDMPALGPYDSRARDVIEQHAKWIADSGVGAINMSWWGQGSYEDQAADAIMDVMRAYNIQVTFHFEPYAPDRATRFVDDVLYVLQRYGERRHWDTFLLLENADGRSGPVFKTFATIVPPTVTDCRGVTSPNPSYIPDDVWRQQTDRLRRELSGRFDHVTLLADSLDVGRTAAGGFDGGTSGDPYVHPDRWMEIAGWFSDANLLFSFGANPGFDAVEPRTPPSDPCYSPRKFEPPMQPDWQSSSSRHEAQLLSAQRIAQSLGATVRIQSDPRSYNTKRGFFLVYVNSFNEWHEGTAFEPMKSLTDLSSAERQFGYHNPPSLGDYRIKTLRQVMDTVVQ